MLEQTARRYNQPALQSVTMGRNTMPAGRSSRSWAAWTTSAVLHAVVAALILRGGGRAARRLQPAVPETVEFDLDVEAPRIPSAPSPSPSPRQAGRGDKGTDRRHR